MMRGRFAVTVGLLMVLALLPAWAGPAPSRVPGNVLVIGQIISDSNSLDPAQAFEFGSVWADAQVYDTLVDFSRDFTRAVPKLATSWTASSDGKTYTFKLRTGAKSFTCVFTLRTSRTARTSSFRVWKPYCSTRTS